MSATNRPKIAKGDILFGRPLFRDRPKTDTRALGAKEHPMLVLRVVENPDNPNEINALTIPMSTSPINTNKTDAYKIRRGTVRGLRAKEDADRWFCPDSPNMIRLNGADNGLRHNAFAPEGTHPFKHAQVPDTRLVDKLYEIAYATMMDGYRPPFQGETQRQTQIYLASQTPDRRITAIQHAARLESDARIAAAPRLGEAITAAQKGPQKRTTLILKTAR